MDYLLQTKEVSKNFGGKMAVDRVSIGVKKGDIYGFIGENGAGKTTLMRMVCGLAEATSGEIMLFGSHDLVSQRHRIGCTIENPALYPSMTAMENMEAQRFLLGIKDEKVSEKLLDTVGLSRTGKKKAKNFSLGMKQRLMIALSLLGDPELLVLDEPTNGLDPMGIKEVRDLFLRLNEDRDMTILISSHILGELEKIATRYGIISNGKMVDEFQAGELSARCGKNLLIYANDPRQTKEIISHMFVNALCEQTPENAIRLKGHIEDASHINTQLVNAGITVNALIPEGESLEDYFMSLMGGEKHA
jgi:ABC-type multidrug transport system, ATPase component